MKILTGKKKPGRYLFKKKHNLQKRLDLHCLCFGLCSVYMQAFLNKSLKREFSDNFFATTSNGSVQNLNFSGAETTGL